MKKFFVSLLLLLSMALSYALPPLEGFWEQDALFSSDYGIRITEHYIIVFDHTIENRKAQTFKYEEIYEGTISIHNFNVSLASEYPEFRSNYFSYERDGNKLVLRGNYGGEIKLKRTPDTPYMADFWCEDKIGNSRFFLDVSYDKFIYVTKDGSFANVWEIENTNATEKWIKLKHQDYISTEVDDVLRNHLMKSDYVRYDRKGEKMTLDLLTGKLKLVTDTRKTFVKNAAIGVGVTAAVVTAAVVGYNVYNSYQQSADNGQKQSYNNGKTSSGTGGKNVAAGTTNTSSNSYKQNLANTAAKNYNSKYTPYSRGIEKGLKGITQTVNGGVDFVSTRYLYTGKGVKNIVQIEMTGSRYNDFNIANELAGLPDTPKGYVWHHLDDYDAKTNTCTLELIKIEAHNAVKPHSGACAQYRAVLGTGYE